MSKQVKHWLAMIALVGSALAVLSQWNPLAMSSDLVQVGQVSYDARISQKEDKLIEVNAGLARCEATKDCPYWLAQVARLQREIAELVQAKAALGN